MELISQFLVPYFINVSMEESRLAVAALHTRYLHDVSLLEFGNYVEHRAVATEVVPAPEPVS